MSFRQEFKVHKLSADGLKLAEGMADRFSALLDWLEGDVCMPCSELTIAKRKLEEACFYAKKAMAQRHCLPGGVENG